MTTPGGGFPGGALTGGDLSALGGLDEASWRAGLNAKILGPAGGSVGFNGAAAEFAKIAAKIAQVLADVVQGVVQGALEIGGVVVGTVVDIVDAIVQWGKNILGAILGGGPRAAAAGLPDTFTEGPLRDVAEGQNVLIGDNEALREQAGFCRVTQSATWRVTGHVNEWMPAKWDHNTSANKNARLVTPSEFLSEGLGGVLVQAPGLWTVKSKMHVVPAGKARRYCEASIMILGVDRIADTSTGWPSSAVGKLIPRLDLTTTGGAYHTGVVSAKAEDAEFVTVWLEDDVVIPDDPPPNLADAARVPAGWLVTTAARFRTAPEWQMIGGSRRATLSVVRSSTDTTDYGAPTDPVGPVLTA